MDKETNDISHRRLIKESLSGLIWGILMMIVTFLFVHYILGFEAFS